MFWRHPSVCRKDRAKDTYSYTYSHLIANKLRGSPLRTMQPPSERNVYIHIYMDISIHSFPPARMRGIYRYMYICTYIFMHTFTSDSKQAARQPTARTPSNPRIGGKNTYIYIYIYTYPRTYSHMIANKPHHSNPPGEEKSYMYTCIYIFIYVSTPDSEQAARQPTAHHPTPE